MTTTKKAVAAAVVLPAESPVIKGGQAGEQVVLAEAVKVPVFRDKEFTSRTLILPDGRTVRVVRGRVEATDLELLTFLRARSSFELVTE